MRALMVLSLATTTAMAFAAGLPELFAATPVANGEDPRCSVIAQ